MNVFCSLGKPSDDFIEEILLSSPAVTHGEDGRVTLTDPFGISEQIIEIRNDILLEWIVAMEQVPVAHQSRIRAMILNKQMGSRTASPGKDEDDSTANAEFQ